VPRTREPAWGERDAITGYYPQYRISAALVIKALRADSLQWIAVADPKAGRVDDFQIGSDHRVDGFQFKWKRYGGVFKFSDLTSSRDSKPSLIEQLADGWIRLKALYPNQRIAVHLVTNQHPSTGVSKVGKGNFPPEPSHFAAFIEQAWKPAHTSKTPEIELSPSWQQWWDEIQAASRLSEAEFRNFVRDCDLEFEVVLPSSESANDRFADLYTRDLEHVAAKIFEAVYDPKIIIRLTRDELLAHLGWKDRFEYRNRHYFPVNESLYQPIETSKKAIETALDSLEGGYVGLLGSPGSGKSTLLTQTLRYFPARVIRYYAFVPDSQSTAVRGESVNFLHDIVRAIEHAGFRPGDTIVSADRAYLRARLIEQLQLLREDWERAGRKTIVLVDGLDHIPREQHPSRSLLSDLPDADQIPTGVYFVLGTQTDQLDDLPNSVQFAIQQPERRIEIDRLTRKAVRTIVQRTDLADALSSEQMDRVFDLSGGHPLALGYLLNELQGTTDRASLESVLAKASEYRGQIDEQYHGYWRVIDQDDELASLLAIVARLRGVIDLKWIESWADGPALRRLRRKFSHLFRVEDNNRWYFFHNSFRLYLRQRTAQIRTGALDVERDRALHLEIANRCRTAVEPRWQWEEIYYLHKAESFDQLLERATPQFFREQFLSYRSLEAIRADLSLSIVAAGAIRNVISLVRLMLSDAEMAQRQGNIDRFPLAPTLLSFGEYEAAIEHLRDGQHLIGSPENVLAVASSVLFHGLESEARELFDLAEPLDLLSGARQVRRFDPSHETHYLKIWASSAIHFRPVDQVVAAINRVLVEDDWRETDESTQVAQPETVYNEKTRELRASLLLHFGLALVTEARWQEITEIEKVLSALPATECGWLFVLRTRSWLKCLANGDQTRAHKLIHDTVRLMDQTVLNDSQRVTIAEGIFRIDGDEDGAKAWLEGVGPIGLQTIPDFNFPFSIFHHLFRYARLLYYFGDQREPAEMIAATDDPRRLGSVYFQRGICAIARLWAFDWHNRTLDQATIRHTTFPLLRLFYHNWRDTKWDSWYSLVELKSEFYEMLIDAVSLHGFESIRVLAEEFEEEWRNNARYWSSDDIRKIVMALTNAGIDADWASTQFERVTEIVEEQEKDTRIEQKLRQVEGWLDLHRYDRAEERLREALIDASSIGNKDYQLGEWIEWLREANAQDSAEAPERIAWFAEAVSDLERNGGPSQSAAYALIEATCDWSPRRAVLLFVWLFSQGLIRFSEAVGRMVRGLLASNTVSPAIAESILLHFVVSLCDDDEEVTESVLAGTFRAEGKKETIRFGQEFKSAIEVSAFGTRRPGWLRGLAKSIQTRGIDISEIGLAPDRLTKKERYGTDEGLKLKDGTILTLEQVKTRAQSVAGVRELVQAKSDSFYHWDEVIANLEPKLTTSAEVMEVVSLFTQEMFSASILARLARRMMELGDRNQARNVARLVLDVSEPSGWAVHLSGGTKIDAFRVLTAIDGYSSREEAFSELVRDMSLIRFFEGSTYTYSSSTVQYLRDIPLRSAVNYRPSAVRGTVA
jgi:hypothetical protein